MLEAYKAGKFSATLAALEGDIDFKEVLKQLQDQGPAWIDAGGPGERDRRELVAATFALEAARAGEWREWKFLWRQPEMCAPAETKGGCVQPLNVLEWKAPPLLIEWACRRLREDETPKPIERWWQLAALAVAQRSEDGQFLVGDTSIGLGVGAGEILNPQLEIKHLEHVRKRFPEEMRFVLAEGIARDRFWKDDATQAYSALYNDAVVGGEAMMRMGVMLFQMNRTADALQHFDRAESLTRDRYVIYLVKYFRGRIAESQRRTEDAVSAYRGAVAAWPRAQSATLSLASLLFQNGRRAEAQELAASMLEANPQPIDPWREYVHADNRFWPLLIGKLRAEILK
jgi:tetratricopeptide (TPR) repeat protein